MRRCLRYKQRAAFGLVYRARKAAGAYFLYLLQNIRKAPGFAEEPLKRGRRCLRLLSCRRPRAPEKRPCPSSWRGTSPSPRRRRTARNRPRSPGRFLRVCRAPGYFASGGEFYQPSSFAARSAGRPGAEKRIENDRRAAKQLFYLAVVERRRVRYAQLSAFKLADYPQITAASFLYLPSSAVFQHRHAMPAQHEMTCRREAVAAVVAVAREYDELAVPRATIASAESAAARAAFSISTTDGTL